MRVARSFPDQAALYLRAAFIFFPLTTFAPLLDAQGLSPATPAREYIRLGGQIVAVENALALQSVVHVDLPASQATYSGMQNFAGWALDNLSSVARVEVSIDGVSYGQAQYGVNRSDVCNSYPASPGCPNVGWSFALNTAALPNTVHTLEVTAFTADAAPRQTTTRIPFSTSNTNPAPVNLSPLAIDSPSWKGTFSGVQSFYGWAVNRSGISAVNVAIDGISYGPAAYGGYRPDVCTASSPDRGCPNVGWNFSFDTSQLEDGLHTFSITAVTSDAAGSVSTASIDFEVDNSYSTVMAVDLPSAQASYSGTQQFQGWSVNFAAPVGTVSIAVDGLSYGNVTYGGSRPDVCGAGTYNGCPNVGWTFPFNTAELANGPHTLTVTAYTTEDDPVQTTYTTNFSTNNPNPAVSAKSQVNIELPAPNTVYAGRQDFHGWALDNTSAIGSVNVAIDGVPYGPAVYGGARPDVCNAYPGRAGCPNVGWNFSFNTAQLTDGVHTLTVTALTTDATPRPTSATMVFTTKNSQISLLFEPTGHQRSSRARGETE